MPDRRQRLLAALVLIGLALGAWALWPREGGVDSAAALPVKGADADATSMTAKAEEKASAADRERIAVTAEAAGKAFEATSPIRLLGRVERPDQAPVADAEVALLRRDADAFWNLDLDYGSQVDTVAVTRTDVRGRFAFDVARGVLYRLRAKAAGAAPALKTGCAGGQFVLLVAMPELTLSGVVRSKADHAPVADARVRLRQGSADVGEVSSLRDGTFQSGGLPAGKCTLRVTATGLIEKWQEVEIAVGAENTVEVLLEAGRSLRGTVSDAISQAPIGDARVAANWTMSNAVVTDSNGRYELSGMREDGLAEVHVHATGYAHAVRRAGEARDDVLDFTLARGGGVRGRIVDGARQPMARAYIAVGASFETHQGAFHTDWLRAAVAKDGSFTVAGLMPEHRYWLYARADGCGARTWVLPRTLPPGEWHDVGEVQLLAGAVIEGGMKDGLGKPVAGIEVRLHGMNRDSLRLCGEGAIAPPDEVSQFTIRDVKTDETGRFRFAGVAAGSYDLSAHLSNLSKQVKAGPFAVEDGQVLDGIEMVFEPGLSLSGRMRLPPGLPSDARWSLVTSGKGTPTWASVTADGSFRFDNLDPGRYRIHLHEAPPGWAMAPVALVEAGSTDVELTPVAATAITGRVVDANDKPVRAQVYARSPTEGPFPRMISTDAEGKFQLWVLPGAPVTVHATMPDDPKARCKHDDVQPGADLVLRLGK